MKDAFTLSATVQEFLPGAALPEEAVSLAALMPGLPVRRGPIESKSVSDSFSTWELSMPTRKIRCAVASGPWAASVDDATRDPATIVRMRSMREGGEGGGS